MKLSIFFAFMVATLILFSSIEARTRTIFFYENGQFSTFGTPSGKSFSACNPCTFKLYVFPHDQPYSEVILQFKVTQGQTTECGCVMHDCYFMTRCGSPNSDCQSEGWWGYVPECAVGGACRNGCGNIYDGARQSCVACGRYVGVYPSTVYLESDNSDLAEWNKGDSDTIQTKNFADDVNYLCPPSSQQCIMTLTASSTDNIGSVSSFEVISEQFVTTTTTTPTTTIPETTTINPCPQGICGLNCPNGYADACGCSCNPPPKNDWKIFLTILIIGIIFVLCFWLLTMKNH